LKADTYIQLEGKRYQEVSGIIQYGCTELARIQPINENKAKVIFLSVTGFKHDPPDGVVYRSVRFFKHTHTYGQTCNILMMIAAEKYRLNPWIDHLRGLETTWEGLQWYNRDRGKTDV